MPYFWNGINAHEKLKIPSHWIRRRTRPEWLLGRRYKEGEDARSFLRREVSYTPNRAAFLMLANGPRLPVYSVLLNELELLEEKLKPTVTIPQTA